MHVMATAVQLRLVEGVKGGRGVRRRVDEFRAGGRGAIASARSSPTAARERPETLE